MTRLRLGDCLQRHVLGGRSRCHLRLLVTGSKKSGWHIEDAPTPSDNTCNPLIVDLTINDKSASGVALVTNPKTPGKYKVKAQIVSQDSAAVAKFTEKFKITK
ncbi:MAG: hypothetical protein ABI571_07810 [Actinomycetota bacterium]